VKLFYLLLPQRNLLLTIALSVPAFVFAQQPAGSDKFESLRNEIRLVEQGLEELLNNSKPTEPQNPARPTPWEEQSRPTGFRRPSAHTNAIRVVGRELSQIENNLLNLSRDGGKPPPEFSSVPQRTVPRDKLLSLRPRGSYFLFVNPGISLVNDRKYYFQSNVLELQANHGYHFSTAAGKQFGSWSLGVEIGHRRFEYDTASFPVSGFAAPPLVNGDSRSNYFTIIGGYDVAISKSWNLRSSLALGVAKSEEEFTIIFPSSYVSVGNESKSHLQGSAGLALEYAFSQMCAVQLGYRFTYLSEMGSYEALPINQLELGLRWSL